MSNKGGKIKGCFGEICFFFIFREKGCIIIKVKAERQVIMRKVVIEQSEQTKKVLQILKSNGYSAHIVGGGVRDAIMGLTPGDVDITTSATPVQIKSAFCDYKTVDTGIKHGTVTVIVDRIPIEITTYRCDGTYSDNRHPDNVRFTTELSGDLSRRDFTVNAIAYSDDDGIVDLFGGIDDIENKIIRAVGDPKKRFCEDALRIMRGVRFASTLGFSVEEKTALAMNETKKLLSNISAERKFSELKKLLCGKNCKFVLENYGYVITAIIPELSCEDVTKAARLIEKCPQSVPVRLAALLKCTDKYESIIKSFKPDNFTFKRTKMLIEYCSKPLSDDTVSVAGYINELKKEGLDELLILKAYDGYDTDGIKSKAEYIVNKKIPVNISELNICGDELILLGAKKGKPLGNLLIKILYAVQNEYVENKNSELKKYAYELLKHR